MTFSGVIVMGATIFYSYDTFVGCFPSWICRKAPKSFDCLINVTCRNHRNNAEHGLASSQESRWWKRLASIWPCNPFHVWMVLKPSYKGRLSWCHERSSRPKKSCARIHKKQTSGIFSCRKDIYQRFPPYFVISIQNNFLNAVNCTVSIFNCLLKVWYFSD